MTTTLDLPTNLHDDELVAWAASFGPTLAEHAARHDSEGTWVAESFATLRDARLLALPVPRELGGAGATIRQTGMVLRELARHCGSTALALSMHLHTTSFLAWVYRHGIPGPEATLRRIVTDRILIVTTGGNDLTRPRGRAERVDGGYRINAHKVFCSQSVAGTVLSTLMPFEDPDRGLRVLSMVVPFSDPGVHVHDNWDTLGMRGTASNDVTLTEVFVPDERVTADRPHGVIDEPLQVIACIALSIILPVYLGIAEGAAAAAIDGVGDRATDVSVQRQVGLMKTRLQIAGWALDGALGVIGDDPQPSMANVAAALAAKREVANAGIEVCDLAMEITGGRAFFKGHPIERAYRDIRGLRFHPFPSEFSLLHAGRLALGQPCDEF